MLVHAQDAVKAELLVSAAHEEAVAVKQEQQRERDDDEYAERQRRLCRRTSAHTVQKVARREIEHDVEHGRRSGRGEDIRNEQAAVIFHAAPRQSGIETELHFTSPPDARMVSVSEIFW